MKLFLPIIYSGILYGIGSNVLQAQNTYLKTFTGLEARKVIQTADRGYLIGGMKWDDNLITHDHAFLKISESGEREWSTWVGENNLEEFVVDMHQGPSLEYLVLGHAAGSELASDGMHVMRLNIGGGLVGQHYYGLGRGHSSGAMIKGRGTSYYIGGDASIYGNGSPTFRAAYLVKANATGNPTSSWTYGSQTEHETIRSMDQDANGDLLLYMSNGHVTKTDSAGNHIWTRTFNTTGFLKALKILFLPNGKYATLSTVQTASRDADIFLNIGKADGSVEWSYYIGGSKSETAAGMILEGDSALVILGTSRTYNHSGNNPSMILTKVDLNAKKVWARKIGATGIDSAAGLVHGSDGGYLLAGNTRNFGNTGMAVMVVKTDQQGFVECHSDDITQTLQMTPANTVPGTTSSGGGGGWGTTGIAGKSGSISNDQAMECCHIIPETRFHWIYFGNEVSFTNQTLNGKTYTWDFGDGNTASTKHAVHTYADTGIYNVCLMSNSGCGSDTICREVYIPCLQAGFEWTAKSLNVDFNQTSSMPDDAFWVWEFGDGNSDTVRHPRHSYMLEGNYEVCLKVHRVGCISDTICQFISVECLPPRAGFLYSDDSLTVQFTDTSWGGTTFYWTFGDSTSDSTRNPVHTYTDTGTYQVCLYISDTCGTDSFCVNLYLGTDSGGGSIGIARDKSPGLRIVPNPNNGRFIVEQGTYNLPQEWTLLDITGRRLLRPEYLSVQGGSSPGIEFALDFLEPGTYLLQGKTEMGQWVQVRFVRRP